ncbi:MAG: DUF5715 family protein [Acidobacteriota bacterium]
MKKVILHIDSPDGQRSETLGDELTIGRTDLSQLAVGDSGLSRKNTTFFQDGDEILVVDEGSLNGTFVNGEQITGGPRPLRDGDLVKIGSSTTIRVEIVGEASAAAVQHATPVASANQSAPPALPAIPAAMPRRTSKVPALLIAAGVMSFVIIFGALIALLVVTRNDPSPSNTVGTSTPVVLRAGLIPMRVIDPLGGEDEDDLDDLIASWETQEKEIDATTVSDVAVAAADTDEADLAVSASLLADRQKKAFEPRNAETGIRPAGLNPPKELFGDGVIKQKAKLREMKASGYDQPMDFADLAEKRLKKELIEMPMATKSFYLDVGGSASEGPFSSFSFQGGNAEIVPGTPKYQALAQLAANFAGQKYDLNNPADRKQIRIRLLRMFNPRAKPILQELAEAYFGKYGRPLRVTSLTRSMDYQIGLNATNVNSFKVRGEGALPPHTSGCAFDLARKHMTAEEQNFVMAKLAEMENAKKLDALIEYGENACFHIFIYSDGLPPKM